MRKWPESLHQVPPTYGIGINKHPSLPRHEMTEHRTQLLNRESLLDELAFVSSKLMLAGIREAQVSFGWDCNLPIDDMWQARSVSVDGIPAFVRQAEQAGIVEVGRGDIVVESPEGRAMGAARLPAL